MRNLGEEKIGKAEEKMMKEKDVQNEEWRIRANSGSEERK